MSKKFITCIVVVVLAVIVYKNRSKILSKLPTA